MRLSRVPLPPLGTRPRSRADGCPPGVTLPTPIGTGAASAPRADGAPPAGRRTLQVETPEHVLLGYELADLGSRFLALLLDLLLIFALSALVSLLALGGVRLLGAGSLLADWWLALVALVLTMALFGYLILFEGLREGQTPGKKRVGIRVVHDGGFPLTFRGAVIRNLVRIVDFQPGLSFAVAGVVMMLHPRTKRLGDIAAGTLVVRDRGDGMLPEDAWSPATAFGRPRLDDAQFATLDRYVARRGAIAPEARARLATAIASALAEPLAAEAGPPRPLEERLTTLHADESARRAAAGTLPGRGSRQAAELVRQQRARWEEYDELLRDAQRRGLGALREEHVSHFAALYRSLAADLARARTYGGSGELVYALERRVGAGHNLLYRPGPRSWAALREWLAGGFPALVRRRWRAVAMAAALLYLPGIATYVGVREDPMLARELLPAGMIARAEAAPGRLAAGRGYIDVPERRMATASAAIFSNNVRATFAAFAGGVLAGIGTILVLLFNGIQIGASLGLYDRLGAGVLIWTFVAGHGVIELTAICIAGGAGLLLGWAIVAPGRRRRGQALVEAARDAVPLLAGTTLMLGVSGLIEGFVSPAPIPAAAKVVVSIASAVATAVYLLGAGRTAAPDGAKRRPPPSEAPVETRVPLQAGETGP